MFNIRVGALIILNLHHIRPCSRGSLLIKKIYSKFKFKISVQKHDNTSKKEFCFFKNYTKMKCRRPHSFACPVSNTLFKMIYL